MVFDYYQRLSPRERAIYRKSDEIGAIRLPRPAEVHAEVNSLVAALKNDDRAQVERVSAGITRAITEQLVVPPVLVEVLAVRPQLSSAELHGLYTEENGEAHIRLWMRTAKKKRVVAFRTFLRTLLHEICHHLDFTLLQLPDSFHTQGFFKRAVT